MENYCKARTVEQPCPCPFPGLPSDTPEVRVKDGSKIRNLMGFAVGRMDVEAVRCILFSGTGRSVAKAITCVEILKRRVKGLHQHTHLLYHTVQEIWEPREPDASLDTLTVSRNVPAIWVLLSKDPLDPTRPGYQAPGRIDTLWAQAAKEEEAEHKQGSRRKRGGGGRGGGGSGRGKGGSARQGVRWEGGKVQKQGLQHR
ncbi:ribonuclease P protein subunit p25-like protein [Paramormyrops kingsleyae]|uniref:Ribonuclease P/MRP 25 subunit-like n=1 Tax=Paramormyrops kingsleyae TaxID=1676925 RepID=A0A3B3SX57_9TELE|nr:ribonuclease P protein subunit p25-like protein [Paramormyrops kingsleyae]